MSQNINPKIVIGVSSRALYNLDDSNKIFEEEGIDSFKKYQIAHEEEMLEPGVAFALIKKLLNIKYPDTGDNVFEVILISKNDANTGLRIMNSIEKHKLNITRACFTCGKSPYKYLNAFNVSLFLSAKADDVRLALENNCAAATILPGRKFIDDDLDELRIAFDGDAVIFSDEAEVIYQQYGLEEFQHSEFEKSKIPLTPGPFKSFLEAITKIQNQFKNYNSKPIRTALVTARGAPAHKRAINTLRDWGINIDEAFFLGGLNKVSVLREFNPHIYFDDQEIYCKAASQIVPTGHVPNGIKNIKK